MIKGKLKITIELDGGDPAIIDFVADFPLGPEVLGRLQALAGMIGVVNLAKVVGLSFDLGSLMMLQEHAKAAMKESKKHLMSGMGYQ